MAMGFLMGGNGLAALIPYVQMVVMGPGEIRMVRV